MQDFEISADTLTVHTELVSGVEEDFRIACDELLEIGGRDLTIDMSHSRHIVSTCIGVISALWVDALSEERDLRLVVSPEVRRVLEYAGFDHVFTLEDGPRASTQTQKAAH